MFQRVLTVCALYIVKLFFFVYMTVLICNFFCKFETTLSKNSSKCVTLLLYWDCWCIIQCRPRLQRSVKFFHKDVLAKWMRMVSPLCSSRAQTYLTGVTYKLKFKLVKKNMTLYNWTGVLICFRKDYMQFVFFHPVSVECTLKSSQSPEYSYANTHWLPLYPRKLRCQKSSHSLLQ